MPGSGYPATASSVSRFVMKQNTAGQTVATASSVSTPASGTSYGSWVQVTASTSVEYYIVGVAISTSTTRASGDLDGPILVDVGRGAAASEVALATAPCGNPYASGSNYGWVGEAYLPAPIRVASSSRIAVRVARVAAGSTSAQTFTVAVYYVPYLSVEGN